MLGAGHGSEMVARIFGSAANDTSMDASSEASGGGGSRGGLRNTSSFRSTGSASSGDGPPSRTGSGVNLNAVPYNAQHDDPGKHEGMIPRVVAEIFELLLLPNRLKSSALSYSTWNSSDSNLASNDNSTSINDKFYGSEIEYTVRCSFVEIYLERIRDLFQPSRRGIRVGPDEDGVVRILGATELCCVDPYDVYALLARGSAFRTKMASDESSDSSRSHAVFTVRIDQLNRSTGRHRSSHLQLLDLAGSEFQQQHLRNFQNSAVILEAQMINKSLACVCNMVRATLEQKQPGGDQDQDEQRERRSIPPEAYANATTIAKLLYPHIGGHHKAASYSTLICTASSASHSIGHTVASLQFGEMVQKLANVSSATGTAPSFVANNIGRSLLEYRLALTKAERRCTNLTVLIQVLVREFSNLRGKTNVQNPRAWMIVDEISNNLKHVEEDERNLVVSVDTGKNGGVGTKDDESAKMQQRLEELEKQLRDQKLEAEKAKQAQRDMMSQFLSLRTQVEVLQTENQSLKDQLVESKSDNLFLMTRKAEAEHNLRTSQFRESEATTFLRQFRSFYVRLLKNKAAQGSGDIRQVTEELNRKIPGVPELADLINIDSLMMKSGLIEQKEVGEDTNTSSYFPSKEALSRSADEAEMAYQREQEMLNELETLGQSSTVSDKMKDSGLLSVVHRLETAQFVAHRQRLLKTPAGLANMKKEKELENELLELSRKCINLQNALDSERAMVEALSGRQGALSKIKSATEMNLLQQELERKTNDLQAIIWTMNELHLVNKAVDERVHNREQYISRLEEKLVDYQTGSRRLVMETQDSERQMKVETERLRDQLDGMMVSIWQLGDATAERPSPWRLVVPFNSIPEEELEAEGERLDERQLSVGSLGEDLDAPDFREFVRMVGEG